MYILVPINDEGEKARPVFFSYFYTILSSLPALFVEVEIYSRSWFAASRRKSIYRKKLSEKCEQLHNTFILCTYKTAYTPAHFSQSKANEHDRRKAQECSAKQSALNAPNIFVWLSVNWKFSKEMPVAFGQIISVQMWMGLKELAQFIVMGIRQTNQTSKI